MKWHGLLQSIFPVHLILLDLIILIIFGESYKSRNFSLCSIRHSPVISLSWDKCYLNL
jgi:hypothetical protein